MKFTENEAINLKKNLINNSVIRGGKITSIAVNYRDWFESFKQNSLDFQEKQRRIEEERLQKAQAEIERKEREKKKIEQEKAYNEVRSKNISQENIFVPTDDELIEVVAEDDENKEIAESQEVKSEAQAELAEEVKNVHDKEILEEKELENLGVGLNALMGSKDNKKTVNEIKEKVEEIENDSSKVNDELKEIVGDISKEVSKEDIEAILDVVGPNDEGVKNIKEELQKTNEDVELQNQEKEVLEVLQNSAQNNEQGDKQNADAADVQEEADLELDF